MQSIVKPSLQRWCFRSYHSWAWVIRQALSPHEALLKYSKMLLQTIPSSSYSMLALIESCTNLKSLATTQHLHAHSIHLGLDSHVFVATSLLNAYFDVSPGNADHLFDEMPKKNRVTYNTMITGYSMWGDLERARLVFDEMPMRDCVSWSAMISAYVNNGKHQLGLSMFRRMRMEECLLELDIVCVLSVLVGCRHMGSSGLLLGKSVHGFAVVNGWEVNGDLGAFLVDMYVKCGSLNDAAVVFKLMEERDVHAWTALICGLAQDRSNDKWVLTMFEMMINAGVTPNEAIFNTVLNVCVHLGLVEEGAKYFKLIKESGLSPQIQHYRSVVLLYSQAGRLEEAYEFIKNMKLEPDVTVWKSFMSACKERKQFEMALSEVEQVRKTIRPDTIGGGQLYSLISDVKRLRKQKWDGLLLKMYEERRRRSENKESKNAYGNDLV